MLLDPLRPVERAAPAAQPSRTGRAERQRADPTGKRRPQARLRAVGEEALPVADWASLHGDLARRPSAAAEAVAWRIHDRTHLELAIDYPRSEGPGEHTWEAYFFLPESFRLHKDTYDKKAIYEDLSSYVRYAVPAVPFYQLASLDPGSPLDLVREALAGAAGGSDASAESALAMQRLRLFACLVRSAGLSSMREIERAPGAEGVGEFIATCGAVAAAFRRIVERPPPRPLPEEVDVAVHWTDEDVSLVLETLCATLGISLEAQGAPPELAEQLAAYAVKEARHRQARGYDSVGSGSADERGTEHFEWRRHLLKRFTASVLWLSLDVRQAATWVVHALYAVAAAAAMAFALAASVGTSAASRSFVRYALPVVVAYAAKDRMKALLQNVFADYIAHHFPDRKWSIHDHERSRRVGEVHERAAFLPFQRVPSEVLARRRATRAHALEEQARPERVLWHQKTVLVHGTGTPGAGGTDFTMLTEIFRLNLHRWLTHTDDPNRQIIFADPEDALVYQATTRRVYNVSVVYRLRSGDTAAPWHRIRVVVSRKGIERIDELC